MKKKNNLILITVALGTFMSSLDTSVVTVVNPAIEKYFNISFSIAQLVLISYLLIVSSMLLTFGRIGDLYGHKKVYTCGFIIFTAASLLCGLSIGIEMLVGCRIIQALGAGMMMSTNSAIIVNSVPAERRGKSLSIIAISVAVALCVGPVLGGVILNLGGWQSIFFVNVPIGVIGTLMSLKNIPKDKINEEHHSFDFAGSIMIFVALTLIIFPLDTIGKISINTKLMGAMIIVGIFVLIAFLVVEKKSKYPMFNVGLFKNRIFATSNIAALFNYMAQFIMIITLINYLENIRKFSALTAGVIYIGMPVATILIAPISGIISDRFASRWATTIGMGIMVVGMLLLSSVSMSTQKYFLVISFIISGLGSGLFQTPNNSAVLGNVPPVNRGTAAGTLGTMRNVGMVVGTAVAGLLGTMKVSSVHTVLIIAAVAAIISMIFSFVKGKPINMECEALDN
ncbi:MFS transporter [Clostridium felsineum]|uniref:MFS transporter n=1 Tax=Clostridium felsineum TaxID=36839 RepID=UPI00214D464A|nr:MFS transporter [Clostridium felsineum]MCR3758481.1 MFS transporter [Clostridium felsineum]